MTRPVLVGAVLYDPKVSIIWDIIRDFFEEYKGALIVTSDARGLHLATWPVLLSWCHAPVFIPWSEVVEVQERRIFFVAVQEIVTRRTPHLRFALRAGTFALVRADARAAGVRGA